jgi:hypothetical protein
LKPAAWRVSARLSREQGGQSAIEYLVIFPMLIMLLFGVIQWTLIYQARSVLNHATLLAARNGAMHNGDKAEMKKSLIAGMAPMFASEASDTGYLNAMLIAGLEVNTPFITTLKVINPTSDAFTDFGRPRLDGNSGNEIPNDTLQYRSTTPGSISRISIQDANILHLRVTYCYRMFVPVVGNVINAVANALPFGHALEAHGMSDPWGLGDGDYEPPVNDTCDLIKPPTRPPGPRLKITSEAIVRMQSPFYQSNL